VNSADATARRAWYLFRSEGSPFAVGLEAVAEVVEADRPVRLPLCSPRVLGLCTVRRDVVPVIRLAGRREDEPRDPPRRLIVLILRTAQGPWGIHIDEGGTVVAEASPEVADGPADDVGPAPPGSLRLNGAAHAVVDAEAAWRDARRDIAAHYRDASRTPDPAFETPGGAVENPTAGEDARGASSS
jgi:purine-binding chemotaxis protein CheW